MKRAALFFAMVALLPVLGCAPTPGTSVRPALESQVPTQATSSHLLDPGGNVVLYVSNQSLPAPVVDIEVRVDGQTVVQGDFDSGDGHNWKKSVLNLSRGRHVLAARSAKGGASFERAFTVKDKHWIGLDYWYNTAEYGTPVPARFDCIIQDTQLLLQ